MAIVFLCPTFGVGYQGFTSNGIPLNAGKIYTYIAGGTSAQATYTTSAGNVQNSNPIVLSADGRTPDEVWLLGTSAYRLDVCDSDDNLIQTYDNISGIATAGQVQNSSLIALGTIGGTANAITAASNPAITAYAANQQFLLTPASENTGPTTLKIGSLAALNLFANGAALSGYELLANVPIVVECDGTQFNLMGPLGVFHDTAYGQITTSVTGINGTNFAGSTSVISLSATAFNGGAYWFEFYSPVSLINNAGSQMTLVLSDGGTDVGWMGRFISPSSSVGTAVFMKRKITPSAGSHTYILRAFVDGNSGTIGAGDGTIGASPPAYFRIYRA